MSSVTVIVLLSFLASAFAFQLSSSKSASAKVVMMADKSKSLPFLPQPPNLVGLPGDNGFDPVGFSNTFDVRYLREAELKHGRIAMLATLGFITADFLKLPGDIHQVSSAAAHDVFVKNGVFFHLFTFIAMAELVSGKAISEMLEGSGRAPGEFGFDPLKLSAGKSDKVKDDLAVKELANGRLAMLAFSGIVTQAVLTGKDFLTIKVFCIFK